MLYSAIRKFSTGLSPPAGSGCGLMMAGAVTYHDPCHLGHYGTSTRRGPRAGQLRFAPASAPNSPIICSRMTYFCGLPVAVIGNSGTKRI
jgi:hypothetical protein